MTSIVALGQNINTLPFNSPPGLPPGLPPVLPLKLPPVLPLKLPPVLPLKLPPVLPPKPNNPPTNIPRSPPVSRRTSVPEVGPINLPGLGKDASVLQQQPETTSQQRANINYSSINLPKSDDDITNPILPQKILNTTTSSEYESIPYISKTIKSKPLPPPPIQAPTPPITPLRTFSTTYSPKQPPPLSQSVNIPKQSSSRARVSENVPLFISQYYSLGKKIENKLPPLGKIQTFTNIEGSLVEYNDKNPQPWLQLYVDALKEDQPSKVINKIVKIYNIELNDTNPRDYLNRVLQLVSKIQYIIKYDKSITNEIPILKLFEQVVFKINSLQNSNEYTLHLVNTLLTEKQGIRQKYENIMLNMFYIICYLVEQINSGKLKFKLGDQTWKKIEYVINTSHECNWSQVHQKILSVNNALTGKTSYAYGSIKTFLQWYIENPNTSVDFCDMNRRNVKNAYGNIVLQENKQKGFIWGGDIFKSITPFLASAQAKWIILVVLVLICVFIYFVYKSKNTTTTSTSATTNSAHNHPSNEQSTAPNEGVQANPIINEEPTNLVPLQDTSSLRNVLATLTKIEGYTENKLNNIIIDTKHNFQEYA